MPRAQLIWRELILARGRVNFRSAGEEGSEIKKNEPDKLFSESAGTFPQGEIGRLV
jgi:hypothetical protein